VAEECRGEKDSCEEFAWAACVFAAEGRRATLDFVSEAVWESEASPAPAAAANPAVQGATARGIRPADRWAIPLLRIACIYGNFWTNFQ
jgi:hypothetical protein